VSYFSEFRLSPLVPNSTFSANFDETFRKGSIWIVWNSTFLFFKILTLNRNINSVSFGQFLTLCFFVDSFTQKNCFWPAESKSVGIFEISLPVHELLTNTFTIF
jgi:hypothetical protein